MTLQEWCEQNNRMDLIEQWHPTKNGMINPDGITFRSGQKVWWQLSYSDSRTGKEFHFEWISPVSDRTGPKHAGCPYLSGKRIMAGFNDLRTWCEINGFESLILEYDDSKNEKSISELSPGSHTKVWWKCHICGYSWLAAPHSRTGKPKSACPKCGREKAALKLAKPKKEHPPKIRIVEPPIYADSLERYCLDNNLNYVLEEWDYDKNELSPKNYKAGSSKKVWWKCKKGHEWCTRISVRAIQKSLCPICNRGLKSSFPEQAVYYYLAKYYNDVQNGVHNIIPMELDNYIPHLRIAVEYDGYNWHSSEKNIDNDIRKNFLCVENDIILIRIREYGLPELSDCLQVIRNDVRTDDSLDECIIQVLKLISINHDYDVSVARDRDQIYELYAYNHGNLSLESLYPELLDEWDYENNSLLPSEVSAHSHMLVHWKCKECGHKWIADIHNRTGKVKAGCPKCGEIRIAKKQKCPIINLSTNEVFDSLGEAAEATGLSKAAILKCIKGESKTSGGYRWQYVNGKVNQRTVRFKKSRRVRNIDTGEIYDSIADATVKTKISNIQAVCCGKRNLAGGYHWEYIDE